MPSYTPQSSSSTYSPQKRDFTTLVEAARPFLREQLELVDPALPSLITVLRSVGSGECFHKHGSFLSHLTDVYRILKLWCAPDPVARCGLLHSAYSNSYVNLAIFDAGTSRDYVRSLVGAPAERLIHLFCVVPRQTLIFDDLLFRYSEAEIVEHLALSEASSREAKENGVFDSSAPWRRKLQSLVPAGGITVKHIKTGEDVAVSRRMMGIFLLMSVADFSDQFFDYQDKMFDNDNWTVLWPGTGKPGLWMNLNSRLGALYTLILREEEIYLEERKRAGGRGEGDRDEEIELVIPPVFDNFTKVLDAQEQIVARDLYWEAVCGDWEKEGKWERVEELLLGSCEKNPFVGEPHLVLAQVYLNLERYEEAEREAERGLELIIEWGSSWDKRMTWEGWVAWGRVMHMKAKQKAWPHAAWGIINLGLVR